MIIKTHKRLINKIVNNFIVPKAQLSYAQFGEDLILAQLFSRFIGSYI